MSMNKEEKHCEPVSSPMRKGHHFEKEFSCQYLDGNTQTVIQNISIKKENIQGISKKSNLIKFEFCLKKAFIFPRVDLEHFLTK